MTEQRDQRIVVGYDGSASAKTAVGWAEDAARTLDADLEVVVAWESMASWVTPASRMRLDEQLKVEAERALNDAVAGVGAYITVTPVLVNGPAPSVLLERGEGARLLVIGARGSGGFLSGVGSIVTQCAIWSTVPTVVVPPQGTERPAGPVVVGVDGSAASDRAINAAVDFASADTPLRLVNGWRHPDASPYAMTLAGPAVFEDLSRKILDEAYERIAPSERHRVETVSRSGGARAVLTAEAESASLVVVGARGHSVLLHRLLGSTVTYLLHTQPAPVMVVPAEADADTTDAGESTRG